MPFCLSSDNIWVNPPSPVSRLLALLSDDAILTSTSLAVWLARPLPYQTFNLQSQIGGVASHLPASLLLLVLLKRREEVSRTREKNRVL